MPSGVSRSVYVLVSASPPTRYTAAGLDSSRYPGRQKMACKRGAAPRTLTFRRVLKHGAVVVLPGVDVDLAGAVSLAARVARHHLDLAVVVLAGLGDVQSPHAVVGQLVTRALFRGAERSDVDRSLYLSSLNAIIHPTMPYVIWAWWASSTG